MNKKNSQKVKSFLRTQLKWLSTGKITEDNFKFKIKDCKQSYPLFDYESEFSIIVEEMKKELISLKN